jgi:hypothetical protein
MFVIIGTAKKTDVNIAINLLKRELFLDNIKIQFVPHRKHITTPLQISTCTPSSPHVKQAYNNRALSRIDAKPCSPDLSVCMSCSSATPTYHPSTTLRRIFPSLLWATWQIEDRNRQRQNTISPTEPFKNTEHRYPSTSVCTLTDEPKDESIRAYHITMWYP